MRKTKNNVEHTIEAIVETGLKVFSNSGYAATNLQDIADALGTTRTPIYYHFKNKLQLYEKVIEDYLRLKEQDFLANYVSGSEDIFEKTRRHLISCCHYGMVEKALFMGIDNIKELEYVAKLRYRSSEFMYQAKKKVVEEAVKKGELKKGTNALEFINHSYILYLGFMGLTSKGMFIFLEDMTLGNILKLVDTTLQGMILKYGSNPVKFVTDPLDLLPDFSPIKSAKSSPATFL
ncbi:MAG: TetR/AcrR family transcriptional regulator [Candidatus Adiutrix sp.]|jgi:TetR/AcrR family acrAB operon transcriptional repressor|nr:TetR/AcrR family transcriptional regulator [Candidatus Adiutrix sp.]